MASPVLAVKNLSVAFKPDDPGAMPVREVDFAIEPGQMLALVGESGSGKSLTALAIMALLPPPGKIAGGSIVFEGRDLAGLRPEELRALRGSEIGMIFQEPMTSLNPVYNVGFHLAEAITSHQKLSKEEIKRRSVELLTEVGIPEPMARLKAYPHELSGGIRQRIMIACAVAMNPKLIIADEPTTALDVTVEAQIMALLDRLKTARGAAVLLVTHDMGLVAQHADTVAVIYAGYIVERSPVAELFLNPLHPYTRALFDSIPTGREGERLTPIPGNVPSPENLPTGCPFRDRCVKAIERCGDKVPELLPYGGGRSARCIRISENG